MRAWLESEWQRLGGGALIFFPLALIFRAIVAVRRFAYRVHILPAWRARVPVVVVGNITVGGTGKTPLVIEILDILSRRGWTPGVIARGYGRVPRREHDPLGVVRVYPDVATPEHFGDEPVLIARRSRVPVYVSPDRPAAARARCRIGGDRRRAVLRQRPHAARGPAARAGVAAAKRRCRDRERRLVRHG